jgi:pyrroloquinoline quinone biosynthesis protein D
MAALRQRLTVTEASKPVLPRHAKLRFDDARQRWVILAPERVLAPDETAVEILQLCDGERTVAQIDDVLAAK